MTKQEQKDYIKRNWSTSSGKRISEMLSRYWKDRNGEKDIVEIAEEMFKTP